MELIQAKFSRNFKEKIKIENQAINGKIALVGPPGVGKTTTIAKLAAKLVLKKIKK